MKIKFITAVLFFITALSLFSCGGAISDPDEFIDPASCAHAFTVTATIFEGDCASPARIKRTCSICGTQEIVAGAVNDSAHKFSDPKLISLPDCLNDGVSQKTCSVCGKIEDIITPADPTAHDLVEAVTPPTCHTDGEKTVSCLICGATQTVVVPKDESLHDFGEDYIALENGHARICSVCQSPKTVLAHGSSGWSTDSDAHFEICTVCSAVYNKSEHSSTHVYIDSTYLAAGTEYDKCTVCGLKTSENEIPRKDYKEFNSISCTYGTKLSEISLPDGFRFAAENTSVTVGNIGTRTYDLIFTIPGDTPFTDTVELSILVQPKEITLSADFSTLSNLVYNGAAAPLPTVTGEYANVTAIQWFKNGEKLSSAPKDAGDYSIKLFCTDANYSCQPIIFDFTIAKAKISVDSSDIYDLIYSGDSIYFDFEYNYSAILTFTDKGGNAVDRPSDIGSYNVSASISAGANYEEKTIFGSFSILPDTESPVWGTAENLVLYEESLFELSANDNGSISYFDITVRNSVFGDEKYATESNTIALSYGSVYTVFAIDAAGNKSKPLFITLTHKDPYIPSDLFPKNSAEISASTVKLECGGASEFYLGTSLNDMKPVNPLIFGLEEKTYFWYAKCGEKQTEVYTFTVTSAVFQYPDEFTKFIGSEIATKIPDFISSTPNGGGIMYSVNGANDFSPLTSNTALEYGVCYDFYATDGEGRISETKSLKYLYDKSKSDVIKFTDGAVSYVNTGCIILRVSSPILIDGFKYMLVRADGSSENAYTHIREVYCSDGVYYACINLDGLSSSDAVYSVAYSDIGFESQVHKTTVDVTAPLCGSATVVGNEILISIGSDNIGAKYYYQINSDPATEYKSSLTLPLFFGELTLSSVDLAGNISYSTVNLGDGSDVPSIYATDGVIDRFTSSDVTLTITAVEGVASYYYINGERFILSGSTEIFFTEDGVYRICTSVEYSFGEVYSDCISVMIDKTAPKIPEIFFESALTRSESCTVFWDESLVSDLSSYKMYFRILELDTEEFLLSVPYIFLDSYVTLHSGAYTLEIIAEDEAGNRSSRTVPLIIDNDPPTAEQIHISATNNSVAMTTEYFLNVSGAFDLGGGNNLTATVRVWKKDGYQSGAAPLYIFSAELTNGDSCAVDLSFLADGATYYYTVTLIDAAGNESSPAEGSFYKYNQTKSVEIDGYVFERVGNGYALFDYIGDDINLILPESVNGIDYQISSGFMWENTVIESVKIPDGILSIGSYAFAGCTSLKSITIGRNVEQIGEGAFSGLCSISDIEILSSPEFIGKSAFHGMSAEALTALRGAYYLGFGDNPCYMLISTDSAASEILIDVRTALIGYRAFFGCTAKEITVAQSVTALADEAFLGCGAEVIKLNASLGAIPEACFKNSPYLRLVTVENGVTSVGASAFEGCASLIAIELPKSVKTIYEKAFADCKSLCEVAISSSSLTVYPKIFDGCKKIGKLYYNVNSIFFAENSEDVFLEIGAENGAELTIGASVGAIADGLFEGCRGITRISFEDGSKCITIGEKAFAECMISHINLPESLKIIKNHAFDGCLSLTTVNIPNGILEIGELGEIPGLCFNVCILDGSEGEYLGNEENPYLVLVRAGECGFRGYTTPKDTKIILKGALSKVETSLITIRNAVCYIGAGMSDGVMAVIMEQPYGWTVNGVEIDADFMNSPEELAEFLKYAVQPLTRTDA